MPILWNVSKVATLETKYDGQLFSFKPGEKKKVYIPDVVNHVFHKLAEKGLVLVPDEIEDEKLIKKLYCDGLARRKTMLKGVIVQYQTVNNERKAAHLGAVEPTEHEIACVKEIKEIEKEISETRAIPKADLDMVQDYLKSESLTPEDLRAGQNQLKVDNVGQPQGQGPGFEEPEDEDEDDAEDGDEEPATTTPAEERPRAPRRRTSRQSATT